MTIIDFAYSMTAPVEAIVFFMMFDVFFERRRIWTFWQYMVGVLMLTIMFALVNNYFLYRIGNLIGMVLSAVLVSVLYYRISWIKRVFVSLSIWVIFGAAEILTLNIITLFFKITANDVINNSSYLVLGIVTSKVLGFAVCYAIRVKIRSKEFELKKVYWLLFLFLFLSSALATFLIYWLLYELKTTDYNFIVMLSTIGLYAGTFLALYLYERSSQQNQIIREHGQSADCY